MSHGLATGSSPHTRGALYTIKTNGGESRIIPAYAGSTGLCDLGPEAAPDHPRIRGEHPQDDDVRVYYYGSSPHTRGAPSVGCPPTGASADHPRIRGEHLVIAVD